MDKKFLLENNLMKAHKKFMELCNEGYISTSLSEADDEEEQNPPQEGGQEPPMPQGDGQMPPLDEPDGGQQPADGAPMPPMGPEDNEPMPPMDGGMPPMAGEDGLADADGAENDDVLDVEDLTQAQEKLNKKQNMVGQDLGQLDTRIEKLLSAVEQMQGTIDHNNQEIDNLKAELEKRVPTPTERLDMQSLKSYPFNVKPDEYWKEKEKEGRYKPTEDDDKKKEYKITNDDVNNYSESDIEKSLDGDLHQTMQDIFRNW